MYHHPKIMADFSDIETALRNAFEDHPKNADIAIATIKKIVFGTDDPVIKNIYLLRFHFLKCFQLSCSQLSVNYKADILKSPFKSYLHEIRKLFVFEARTRFGYQYSAAAIGETLEMDKKIVSETYNEAYRLIVTKKDTKMLHVCDLWARYLLSKNAIANKAK